MFIKLVSSFICSFFIKGLKLSCSGSGETKHPLLSHRQKQNLQPIIQQYSQKYAGLLFPEASLGCHWDSHSRGAGVGHQKELR